MIINITYLYIFVVELKTLQIIKVFFFRKKVTRDSEKVETIVFRIFEKKICAIDVRLEKRDY